MIEFRIPKDPEVMLAMSNYLKVLATGNPHMEKAVTDAEQPTVPPTTEQPVPAPAVTEQPTVPPSTEQPVELDKDGLPWDGRIHASTKSKLQAGTWKKKRGVDPSLISQVEAELRGAMSAGNTTPTPPQVEQPSTAANAFGTGGNTTPTPTPSTGDGATCPATFAEFSVLITSALNENKITQEQLQSAVESVGLANFMVLPTRFDLAPQILTELGL